MLSVSPLHSLSVRQYGNPLGLPVAFIHGGPGKSPAYASEHSRGCTGLTTWVGGGTDDNDARKFDPKLYRIVLHDQRGSGLSTPASSLVDNTTQHLISDIEAIRSHLQIEKWHVFGGSWGSTLSLAYAQAHPQYVMSLTLRGIFTIRKEELNFFYQGPGSSFLFPECTFLFPKTGEGILITNRADWQDFLKPIPLEERGDMVKAYYSRLTGTDEKVREEAGQAWSRWEMATSRLIVDPKYIAKADEPGFADAFARIECRFYFLYHRSPRFAY